MKKRTEILAITLVLTGSAIAAALTSDIGINQAHAEETPTPIATTDTPERELNPVVYEMDIPLDAMSEYEADAAQTADSQPTEDQVASEDSSDEDTPNA